jgi:hypothetical protein
MDRWALAAETFAIAARVALVLAMSPSTTGDARGCGRELIDNLLLNARYLTIVI